MTHTWEKSYPKDVKWNSNIEAKTVPTILDYAVSNFPDKDAIDFLNKKYSYKQLGELVDIAAKSFRELGIKKDSKVGIFLPNCPYFVISYFAILKAGGVVVNCSPLYSEEELEYQLKDSDTEILITLDINLLYPKANSILNKAKSDKDSKLKKLIICSLQEALTFPSNILYPIFKAKDKAKVNYTEEQLSWNDFLKIGEESNQKLQNKISPDDTAVIQYTGGTTGVPKGAELTHANIYINAVQCKEYAIRYPDGEGAMLTCLPLFHVFAMTTAMNLGILTASTLILHPRFEVDKVLKDIHKKKPTGMPGVPAMYNAINNFPDVNKYDLTSLKICVSGGAPLPIEVKKKFEKITSCTLVEGYGLTETSPVVALNPIDKEPKEGSIGLPFPDTEFFIEDMENPEQYLGTGERGELCIRAPQVMKGYYKRPESTAKVMNKDNIMKTGDVAIMDEEGYFFIVDRIKEMIISGGFKIYPRHVEEVLYEHPAIMEAAVIGVDDSDRGQKVKAVVSFKEGKSTTKDALIGYMERRLAKHEIAREIEIMDSLPKSPIGKILKKELS